MWDRDRRDLDQLILMPKNTPKQSIKARAASRDSKASGKYKRTSSAYREIFSRRGPTLMPGIHGDVRIRIARGSITRANRPGDSGHPCLVPRLRGKGDKRIPQVITLAVGDPLK